MNPEKKTRWVERLRSGTRKQGTGVLHRRLAGEDFYCCLGVLCELAIEDGIDLRVSPEPTGDENPRGALVISYDGYEDFLPPKVVEWAGLRGGNPLTTQRMEDTRLTLSYLNDNGKSFREIADIIERDF